MAQEIIRTEYSEVMQKSFIDYSMSVILARAVPDVRDGLKPVQRRTLYDMYELKVDYDKPYKKSARIVGDTMGKYHPHGDSSIYEALVVMSQDFKKSLPLVDGHGNFGSIEGDGAAAMRYTEARLAKVAQEVYLGDLDKNVVDFIPNYDETEKEPEVLPVRVPNLLINGSDGIAVGMVTSIPQHNLGEVIDGVIAYMKDPDINTAQMMKIIPGPDFPTGGIITNQDELLEIYSTGLGKIKIRGKAEIEKIKGGKEQIVITEIPYTMIGANIGKFLNDIYSLVETKKTNDITDISNQSSKDGMRIIVELRKGADAQNVLNLLYKKTRLEDTFGVNMLAVANGRPETLGLVPIIRHHVNFQYELCTRKYTTLLGKEREKKEIQEGLIKACDVIDLIIEILRGSKDVKMAKACLVDGITDGIKFKSEQSKKDAVLLKFTERQAQAILDMRLHRLIGLEIDALRGDYAQTMQKIDDYTKILGSKAEMAKVIIKDLTAIKKEYATERKTVIDNLEDVVIEEKPIEVIDVAVLIDRFAYARVVDMPTFERNKEAAEIESKKIIFCKNTDKLCLFTNSGDMHTIKVLSLPFGKFRDKGQPIDTAEKGSKLDLTKETLLFAESMENLVSKKLFFGTSQSMIKQVDGSEFDVTRKLIAATKLNDKDELIYVGLVNPGDSVVLQSDHGMFLRFEADSVPEKKKAAAGVRGMKLAKNDKLTDIYVFASDNPIEVKYKDKPIALNRLHMGNRDTKGVKK
ncbi:MAG: DNA topoisomerase 4 subunit A [Pseudobutyrivibrio sp.]|nr:DNA topoisomerase 4 subunit A [Pseudobutyrivibrio sp.]